MRARLVDITNPATSSPKGDWRLLWRIILWAFAFKLLIALLLPLGVDEAYGVAVGREYSLSFFDHPPISFWLPVALAQITGIEAALVYRAPFLLAGVATTAVLFLIGREISGPRAGLWTAFLFATAPFFLVSSGILAVPDGTLNLALAVSVLFLVKIAQHEGRAPILWWLAVGAALALALASKYQAAWLPVAVLLFMVFTATGRRWFLQPGPWIAAAIGLIGLVPVLLWNYRHDWVSFVFHASRAEDGFNLKNFVLMSAGQVLFLLPPATIAAVAGLWLAFRRGGSPARVLLALVALGPIVIFNYVYLTSRTSHAHWTMPGWEFALPLAGAWLADRPMAGLRRFYRWTLGLSVVVWAPLLALVIHADTGFLTRPFYDRAPAWDYTLSMFDFGGLRAALGKRGLWQSTDVFMAGSWAFGGILDTALGAKKPMRIVDLQGAHHFVYLSDASATGQALLMEPGTFRDTDKNNARALAQARQIDPDATLLKPIILTRGGQPYVTVSLVRLTLK